MAKMNKYKHIRNACIFFCLGMITVVLFNLPHNNKWIRITNWMNITFLLVLAAAIWAQYKISKLK